MITDCHVHILLQGDVTAADYDEQLLKESIPYRTIRATVAAKAALMNGFTALRDLETEGAMYADVDVKMAINRGVIQGPRMFVSTRAFSTTGTYPLLGYSWELKMPEGVQIVDGADNIRRAVREQVKYGADWIKFYADRRYYMKDGQLHSWVNFTDDERQVLRQKILGYESHEQQCSKKICATKESRQQTFRYRKRIGRLESCCRCRGIFFTLNLFELLSHRHEQDS